MKIDLNKCKASDKLIRRDGKIMTYVKKMEDGRHDLRYRDNETWYWTSKGALLSDMLGIKRDSDIVGILKTSQTRQKKVICRIDGYRLNNWQVEASVNGFDCYKSYTARKNAVRGAKRFAQSIGHECVIADEVKV